MRFGLPALLQPASTEAHSGAQLQQFRLLARDCERLAGKNNRMDIVSCVIPMGCPARCETLHPLRSRLLGVLALRIARWKHWRASWLLRCSLPSWLGSSHVVAGSGPALIVPW